MANSSSHHDLNKLVDLPEKLHSDWETKYDGVESLEFQNVLFKLSEKMQKLMGRDNTNSWLYNLSVTSVSRTT